MIIQYLITLVKSKAISTGQKVYTLEPNSYSPMNPIYKQQQYSTVTTDDQQWEIISYMRREKPFYFHFNYEILLITVKEFHLQNAKKEIIRE